jgi:hypothetical protein
MKYAVLNERDFTAEYHKAFQKQSLETEAERERFRDEVFAVQGAIEKTLLTKWKKTDDFEVGWDFNYCYHTCGGIYSERIFCPDYLATIHRALQSVDANGLWTYHTACEIMVNPQGTTAAEMFEERGEFFVRGDTCYINESSMKPGWRARLGYPS